VALQITSKRRLVVGDRSSQPLSRHPAMASFTVVAGPHGIGRKSTGSSCSFAQEIGAAIGHNGTGTKH
jgi:hypothetical protein